MEPLYRTERSMIFPRCWPGPCASINPAKHIGAQALLQQFEQEWHEMVMRCRGWRCGCRSFLKKEKIEKIKWKVWLWSVTPLHLPLICPDQLSSMRGVGRLDTYPIPPRYLPDHRTFTEIVKVLGGFMCPGGTSCIAEVVGSAHGWAAPYCVQKSHDADFSFPPL